MTENHRALSVTALIAAVLTVSCGSGASTETSPAEQASSAPSTVNTPSSTPFTVYTHCGVENVRLGGGTPSHPSTTSPGAVHRLVGETLTRRDPHHGVR